MKTATKTYYAMQWFFDGVFAGCGKRCARYFQFETAAARDGFVANGKPYRGNGYREAVKSSDSELRAALAADKRDGHIGYRVEVAE